MVDILIHKSVGMAGNCWAATHRGKRAAPLLEYFGTATLPTPYACDGMAASEAAKRISVLNPDCSVAWQDDRGAIHPSSLGVS